MIISAPVLLFTIFIVAAIVVWTIYLTFMMLRLQRHYNRLVSKTGKEHLMDILETILGKQKNHEEVLRAVQKNITLLDHARAFPVQKIGLVRFNPFADIGGEQSFILTLLDANNCGVVISSLYSRTGTRWYAKQVRQGKGIALALSKEESEAVEKAKHLSSFTAQDKL